MNASSPVDAYIAKSRPFAQPILTHLRETVHRVVPDIEETMKWSRPFFLYRGVILGNLSAFKEHCSFGLWGNDMAEAIRAESVGSGDGMGSFGKIRSVDDLPPTAKLEGLVEQAAQLIAKGARTKSVQRVAKPARGQAAMPEALLQALEKNAAAAANFARLSPSCKREYAEWIAEAKREETRARRIATALAWMAEGKTRNWKYEARSA